MDEQDEEVDNMEVEGKGKGKGKSDGRARSRDARISRILTLYQIVHDAIHAKGQGSVISTTSAPVQKLAESGIGVGMGGETTRIRTMPRNADKSSSILTPSSRSKEETRESLSLKTYFFRTPTESVLGWLTSQFEVYVTLSPWIPKSAAVGAANGVVEWVGREDSDGGGGLGGKRGRVGGGRLFLKDAPVF